MRVLLAHVAVLEVVDEFLEFLRHLGLWVEGVRLNPARAPPDVERIVELFPCDPFPDYSMDPVMDYGICADA